MTLLAETATGFVVALNLPDDRVPVVKSLSLELRKRAKMVVGRTCDSLCEMALLFEISPYLCLSSAAVQAVPRGGDASIGGHAAPLGHATEGV